MVWSFLVICFESNAYRNIIKRVETAWTYYFFRSEVIEENGSRQLRVHMGMDPPPEWMGAHRLTCWRGRCVCAQRNWAKLPLGRKSQNSFLCPLFQSWGWIKFLESPCEEGRQEPSEFLMAPLSEGMPFFQLFGLDLRALNISLFFVFPPPCPLPSPSEKPRYSYF